MLYWVGSILYWGRRCFQVTLWYFDLCCRHTVNVVLIVNYVSLTAPTWPDGYRIDSCLNSSDSSCGGLDAANYFCSYTYTVLSHAIYYGTEPFHANQTERSDGSMCSGNDCLALSIVNCTFQKC